MYTLMYLSKAFSKLKHATATLTSPICDFHTANAELSQVRCPDTNMLIARTMEYDTLE